jgi:flagellar hook-associated protein 1 FlgK
MSILGIGVGALNAAQSGLVTTEHNIASASTPGFHRQQILQSANPANISGSGYFGAGVRVDTVKRLYSQFLETQVLSAQTQSSYYNAYSAQITQIDNMLADQNSGLSTALQGFFVGVQDVSANPSSVPARQSMISGAEALASRFQSMDGRLDEIRTGVNGQIGSTLTEINVYAQQISDLNTQISLAVGSGNHTPNDLLDQREQLIADLNQRVNVTTLNQPDGGINIFIGTGQALVVGGSVFQLTLSSSSDPLNPSVAYATRNGAVALDSNNLTGGTLGGLLKFRSTTLDAAQSKLGMVAIGLAQTFNDQHKLGQDLNGAMGGDMFSIASPSVIPNQNNPAGTTVAASFGNVRALTGDDYRLNYNIGSGQWSLLNTTNNQLVTMTGTGTATDPFVADGLKFVTTPVSPTSSVEFVIRPTIDGAQGISVSITDTARLAAAAPIRTTAVTGNKGSASISAGAVNSFNDQVTISFPNPLTVPSTFDVVDNTTGATLASGVQYTSGANISFNGWTLQITDGAGAPAAGDTFVVNNTLSSTTSATATINQAVLNSPSPVDPMLKNSVNVVFDSPTAFHLEGATNNVTGASTISVAGSAAALVTLGALTAGANLGFTVTGVAADATTIGTGGAGSYTSNGVKTTISGGVITGPVLGILSISGATVTVEGGSFTGSTTFSGATISVDPATGTITIPAASGSAIASTFNARAATGLTFLPGSSALVSANGWTVQLSGNPLKGDVFNVGSNTSGVSDNRNAVLLGKLQTTNILGNGTVTYQGSYSQIVSQVGNTAREVDISAKTQASLITQTQEAQQELSGVNIDEEAANLVRYQQAYQAAGKMIQVANTLFATLLGLVAA